MINIAVLASGNGTNFQALALAIKAQHIPAKIKVLITDKENAYVRKRADKLKIKNIFIDPSDFSSRGDFDKKIAALLKQEKVGLVVLAGYMRILSAGFVRCFKNKIINIHPAILPSFKGTDSIKRAYEYGCRLTGVTVHFVDEKVDHGPIILQGAVEIKKGMSLAKLEEKVHQLEHKLYPRVVKLFAAKKIKARGRHVEII